MRPLIAVPGRRAERASGLRFSATVAAEAICEAIWAAGGEPLVLHGPDGAPTEGIERRLARFDGVLLPGGGDIHPRRYGQTPTEDVEDPVPHQDDVDLGAVWAALALGLPALVICRGMQVLNVALGGTLVQHLPAGEVHHRDAQHEVTVHADSRLHAVVGEDRITVSSYHHQAVDRVGSFLTVSATAPDGCIEALEHEAGTMLAVQWHPEDLHVTSATDASLFADLVQRARQPGGHAVDPVR